MALLLSLFSFADRARSWPPRAPLDFPEPSPYPQPSIAVGCLVWLATTPSAESRYLSALTLLGGLHRSTGSARFRRKLDRVPHRRHSSCRHPILSRLPVAARPRRRYAVDPDRRQQPQRGGPLHTHPRAQIPTSKRLSALPHRRQATQPRPHLATPPRGRRYARSAHPRPPPLRRQRRRVTGDAPSREPSSCRVNNEQRAGTRRAPIALAP